MLNNCLTLKEKLAAEAEEPPENSSLQKPWVPLKGNKERFTEAYLAWWFEGLATKVKSTSLADHAKLYAKKLVGEHDLMTGASLLTCDAAFLDGKVGMCMPHIPLMWNHIDLHPVLIRGATGPLAGLVNGVFHPTEYVASVSSEMALNRIPEGFKQIIRKELEETAKLEPKARCSSTFITAISLGCRYCRFRLSLFAHAATYCVLMPHARSLLPAVFLVRVIFRLPAFTCPKFYLRLVGCPVVQ